MEVVDEAAESRNFKKNYSEVECASIYDSRIWKNYENIKANKDFSDTRAVNPERRTSKSDGNILGWKEFA